MRRSATLTGNWEDQKWKWNADDDWANKINNAIGTRVEPTYQPATYWEGEKPSDNHDAAVQRDVNECPQFMDKHKSPVKPVKTLTTSKRPLTQVLEDIEKMSMNIYFKLHQGKELSQNEIMDTMEYISECAGRARENLQQMAFKQFSSSGMRIPFSKTQFEETYDILP